MSSTDDVESAQECAYPGCQRPVIRHGGQGGIPKRYCSNSCRTRDHQRRVLDAPSNPGDAVEAAVEQALRSLSTQRANDAIKFMPADIRKNYEKVQDVLRQIRERVPRDEP